MSSMNIQLMTLVDTLNERPIAFNKHYVDLGCGITGALMLSQLVYWTKKTNNANGWIYKTGLEWTTETGLTRREQETARNKLKELGFITEHKHGVPCKVFFKVEYEVLYQALINLAQEKPCAKRTNKSAQNSQTSLHETDKQVCTKAPNCDGGIRQTNTESTTKNTTENTTDIKSVTHTRKTKPAKFSFEKSLLKLGANKQFVSEFMGVRKAKRAVDSETAFNRFISEQQKSGKSLDEVLELCIVNSWKSFNASWDSVKPKQNNTQQQPQSSNRWSEIQELIEKEEQGNDSYGF